MKQEVFSSSTSPLQEWLVKQRNKVSGPFTGVELLEMVLNDTLAESAQARPRGK